MLVAYSKQLFSWLKKRKLDVIVISIITIIGLFVSSINMNNFPQRFEDEGTYVSQAWAVQDQGALTHYTYWYDHPPVGWILIASHFLMTGSINRYDSAISSGREYMLVLHLASIVLLYALARRLGIGTIAAGAGALAYALSPLVVVFSRYVLLDNVAIPWLLGSMLLALSPRRHILTAIGSAACLAIAVMSKETFLVLLPVVIYALWQSGDKRNRRFCITAFLIVFATLCGFYALYAMLKNELFPGPDHVSLLGTIYWQLFGRAGSGSIFDTTSGSFGLLKYWLNIDFWLLLTGTLLLPVAFFFKNLRVVAFSMLIGLLLMLRTGYMPFPYIIVVLPFAALVFAGVLHYAIISQIQNRGLTFVGVMARQSLVVVVATSLFLVAPAWKTKLAAITTLDEDASSREAVAWIDKNITRDNRMVVESALWTDLQKKGFSSPDPVWLYKTETDPAVEKEIGGWQGIDYVILNGPTVGSSSFDNSFPMVDEAIDNAELIKEFGYDNQKILVYKVNAQKTTTASEGI